MTAAFAIVERAGAPQRAPARARSSTCRCSTAALAAMGWVGLQLPDRRRTSRSRMGNDNFTAAPSGTFRTERRPAQHRRQQAGAVRGAGRRRRAARSSRPTRASPSARARKRNRAALTAELEAALQRSARRGVGSDLQPRSASRPGCVLTRAAGAGAAADRAARAAADLRRRARRRPADHGRARRLQAVRRRSRRRRAAAAARASTPTRSCAAAGYSAARDRGAARGAAIV